MTHSAMNVLIVDSVPANRKLLKEALQIYSSHAVTQEQEHIEIETAESISHGIKRLNHESFDLALVSTVLPDGPIRRFLDETRQVRRAVPPIIVYTLLENATDIAPPVGDLLEAGAYDVIESSVQDTEAFKAETHKAIAQAIKHTQPQSERVALADNPTSQRLTNETLRLYEIALNNSGEAILLFDAQGAISFANEAAANIYNSTAAAMVGLNITNLIDSSRHRVARDMLNAVLPLSGNKRIRFTNRDELTKFKTDTIDTTDNTPTNSPTFPARGFAIREDGAEQEVHFEARNISDKNVSEGGMLRLKPAGRISNPTGGKANKGPHLSLISKSDNDRFLQREVPNRPRFTQVVDIIANESRIDETYFMLAMVRFTAPENVDQEILVWESLSDEMNSILSTSSEIYQYGCWDLDTLAVCALANTTQSLDRIVDGLRFAARQLTTPNPTLSITIGVSVSTTIPSVKIASQIAFALAVDAEQEVDDEHRVVVKLEKL